jgi:hypothetical protein
MSVLSDRTTKQQKTAAKPAAQPETKPETAASDLPASSDASVEEEGVASVDDLKVTPEQFAAEKAAAAAKTAKAKEPMAPPVPAEMDPIPAVKADVAPRVRVVQDAEFLMGTAVCRFKAGQVLSANHYMPDAFREILAQVHTEPVTE